ncbi:MAG: hypothetical protein ACI9NY_000505, partial [Kiritimatiellia bacterium]
STAFFIFLGYTRRVATSLPKKAKNHFIFRTLVTLATILLRYLG